MQTLIDITLECLFWRTACWEGVEMELTTTIMDLEVTIKYAPYKAEPMSWTSPGSPAYMEFEITHICGMSLDKMAEVFGHDSMATLHDWMIERDGKTFEKLAEAACWEDLRW